MIALSGISLGWLVGLSVSPVLHLIVESVLGVIVTIVSALVGVKVGGGNAAEEESDRPSSPESLASKLTLDLVPLAVLTVSLAIGASVGVFARTNELLGPQPDMLVHRWQGAGLSDEQLRSRLLDQMYVPKTMSPQQALEAKQPKSDSDQPNSRADRPKQSADSNDPVHGQLVAGLYATRVKDCDLVLLKHGTELKTRLQAIAPPRLLQPIRDCQNDDCLELAKEVLCPQGR